MADEDSDYNPLGVNANGTKNTLGSGVPPLSGLDADSIEGPSQYTQITKDAKKVAHVKE